MSDSDRVSDDDDDNDGGSCCVEGSFLLSIVSVPVAGAKKNQQGKDRDN